MTPLRTALAVTGLCFLWSCASGPGPDLRGPQGPSIMNAYNGTWTLLRLESDDLAAKLRAAETPGNRGTFGGGMTGGRPGGGMTGRPPGGGMTGGRPGGGAMPGLPEGTDREAMRQAMSTIQSLARTPAEISFHLTPEDVQVVLSDSLVMVLTLGADESQIRQGPLVFFAAADWTKKGVRVEAATDVGSKVKDLYSLDESGHLVLEREVELPGRGAIKGKLVYRREE